MSEAQKSTPLSQVRWSHHAERKDVLSLEGLDASYISLLEDIDILSRQIQEQKEYAMALANGDLTVLPPENNPLCASLIVLQQKLKGLTKQMQRVAQGESPQGAGSLGILSDAFEALIKHHVRNERSADPAEMNWPAGQALLSENNRLIVSLAGALELGVVVFSASSREIILKNQRAAVLLDRSVPECEDCQTPCPLAQALSSGDDPEALSRSWVAACPNAVIHFQINTHQILWEGQRAFIHFIEDVSNKGNNTSSLAERIYRDYETGLFNHRMCVDRIDALLETCAPFCACHFSIDGLHAVSETLGAQEKEAYLHLVVDGIRRSIRDDDFFGRLSENAFIVLFRNLPASIANKKFQSISLALHNMHKARPFKASITHCAMEAAYPIEGAGNALALLGALETMLTEKKNRAASKRPAKEKG